MSDRLDALLRAHWWAAVAAIARRCGDLEAAEDAVQEACVAAVSQWRRDGVPPSPRAWLITTAWHKAVDAMRRDTARAERELAAGRAMAEILPPAGQAGRQEGGSAGDDELALIFACCHPALDPVVRVALTLRSVCGLSTAQIAASFVVAEPAMAQRLVRAKRKIRQAGIPLAMPAPEAMPERLGAVLRVIYLVYTQGHRASSGTELVRTDLCDQAIRLARALNQILPAEPEVRGLLALALRSRRPGPYQLHAAIAACHSGARTADVTDWRQIAALYRELGRYEPTAVILANQAVAIAMADGPLAGLEILDRLADEGRLADWPPLHIARAELLRQLGRHDDAQMAYAAALAAGPHPAEQAFIGRRVGDIAGLGEAQS